MCGIVGIVVEWRDGGVLIRREFGNCIHGSDSMVISVKTNLATSESIHVMITHLAQLAHADV